jgi:amino acid permease
LKNTNLFRRKTVDQILAEVKLQEEHAAGELVRNLTLRDLISMGIAAIIGAGIFSTIGNASAAGGPAVSLLFIFTAIACVFSAMCYAQFASTIPISGSAYTYAYASFGELIAWIIGWDLLWSMPLAILPWPYRGLIIYRLAGRYRAGCAAVPDHGFLVCLPRP